MTKKDMAELAQAAQIELARRRCLTSTLFHAQYFFAKIRNENFIVNDHHKLMCDLLDRVFAGEVTRAIINVAPRYTKTELAVKTFVQKGLAHNAKAKFIHNSYSDTLALDNSEKIREACKHPYYQQLFPHVQISRKSDSKKKWYTTDGGGIYATASGGQVTGFGAGTIDYEEAKMDMDEELQYLTDFIAELDGEYLEQEKLETEGRWIDPYSKFAGAIIIDDPIKPEDAFSEAKRRKVNQQFDSTIRNRVNSKKTPIIVCHQRTHEMDLTGHLLSIEPGVWEVLRLPSLKEDGTALWDLKHTVEQLLHLKKITPYVFQSQYQQDPKPVKRGGEFYKLFEYKNNVVKNPIGKNNRPSLYDPRLPLHVTYDFNVVPHLAIGIWQIFKVGEKGKRAIKIDEVAAKSPNNRTGPASKEFARKYPDHESGLFIYGDPSGKKDDTRSEEGENDFTIILKTLKQYRPQLRKLSKAPAVATRGNFVNALFVEGFEGVEIFIGDNCVESVNDFLYLKEDSDGTKLKEVVTIEPSGIKAQKYGHFSDGDDYFICTSFANEYAHFKSGPESKLSTGKAARSKNTY